MSRGPRKQRAFPRGPDAEASVEFGFVSTADDPFGQRQFIEQGATKAQVSYLVRRVQSDHGRPELGREYVYRFDAF